MTFKVKYKPDRYINADNSSSLEQCSLNGLPPRLWLS